MQRNKNFVHLSFYVNNAIKQTILYCDTQKHPRKYIWITLIFFVNRNVKAFISFSAQFACNFNSGTGCQYLEAVPIDGNLFDFQWTLQRGTTSSSDTGPSTGRSGSSK